MKNSHLILYGLLVLASCDSEKNPASTETGTKSKEVSWEWSSYGKSSELVLRSLPVDLQPKQSFAIKSEAAGIMTFEIIEKTSVVKKGTILARMDVDSLAEAEERLRIREEKQLLDEMRAEKLDLPEKRRKAKEDLREARRKVRLVEMILNNPAMKEMSSELFGGDIGEVSAQSLTEARDGLSLAEKKLAWAEEFDEKIRKGQQRIQEMDLTKTKRQQQDVKDRSVYTIPFDGELRLDVNHVEGKKEYTVGGRETVATLNDYEEIHGHLKVANAQWINMQPQRLYIQLTDQDKTIMPFLDDRIAKDKYTHREERKYIFSVPLKNNEKLKRLAGTQMNAELIYKLPAQCYIVPKYDLSLYALGKTTTLDWKEMVKQLFPGAKVLAEGRKNLAIEYQGN